MAKVLTKRHLIIGVTLVLALLAAGGILLAREPSKTVTIGESTFAVRVVDTPEKRQQGLSGTEPLEPDQGMLFIFETDDYHGIWMKDMNYALDIIWLDSSKAVVHVVENVSPDTYPESFRPDTPSRYVLELPAGAASKHSIAPGAQADF